MPTPPPCTAPHWPSLLATLRALPPLAIAFSGGLDSRFLAHAAQHAGADMLLLHATGAHMPARESHYARHWAHSRGLTLRELDVDTLNLPEVQHNSRERCYHCKKHLLGQLHTAAQDRLLCDGTNADDLLAYRPGLRALKEAGIRSPLAEAGLTKAQLREIGKLTGLSDWEQKARPCLLTRINYGLKVDANLLRRVEEAEEALEDVGLKEFRLRLRPEPLLQTLPLPEALRQKALRVLDRHGFGSVEILEEEKVGGFFDR